MQDYEKLGVFYLGRKWDLAAGQRGPDALLYDARDLTTHGVIVGMTGSGKTGLAIGLLEEAAIDSIPAIVIDPKGDLGNLLLTFPELRPEDFRPWIDEGDASRQGLDADALAAQTAEAWRSGLADWDQDASRIQRLRDAAALTIYTPGSTSGVPLSILRSFAMPGAALADDTDALRERILADVSGLLALMGIDADPVRSREHILLSKILEKAWSENRGLELIDLVRQIQKPPFDRVGALDLDTFCPAADRATLAMTLNNLLASPGFAAWTEGEPLDIARLLWTPEGKPRVSVLSIAHLSDSERMFFVTILLNEVLAWMRAQSGTSSLRALLYMDEVFGFFPPVANPPSKRPMLTLLKQARAFGLGVVLATQNPVDLDYKGLSNAGTWFLGRLQTERDKLRVLDGLEGASAAAGKSFDRAACDAILSSLPKRCFLMSNVHEDSPVVFQTRWTLSYLRGPLTKKQIQTLSRSRRTAATTAAPESTGAPVPMIAVVAAQPSATAITAAPTATTAVSAASPATRPLLPPDVPECFFAPAVAQSGQPTLLYRPWLYGTARLHFVDSKNELDLWQDFAFVAALEGDLAAVWERAQRIAKPKLENEPRAGARFDTLPAEASKAKSYATWQKALASYLYRTQTLHLFRSRATGLVSRHGESEIAFRARVHQALREERDAAIDKLRKKYASRIAQVQAQERRAEERVRREQSQYDNQKAQTAVSMGATVLGALLGRKAVSVGTVGRAATAARGVGRANREREDVGSATKALETVRHKRAELEEQIQAEVAASGTVPAPDAIDIETLPVRPRKADITTDVPKLVWASL